jgi:hypothetical protein
MPKLYITEYSRIGSDRVNRNVQTGENPPVANQTVNIGATSTQSNALSFKTSLVRVHTDAICSIEIGEDPVATVNSLRMAANQTEYFSVPNGFKIAVISNT